jgi:RNA polymerase-interacting CarD/CdnL/TRCF family regulator
MAFPLGAIVVVRGRALGKVVAVDERAIFVEELELDPGEESRFEIPLERAGETLRALVTRDEAERVLAILATKPPRPPLAERSLAYRRAYKGGVLAEQARLLAASYVGPVEAPETQYQAQLERAVFGELALALGVSRKTLRARIRAAAKGQAPPRELADRSAEVDAIEPPELAGYEAIGAFAVDARIAAGESRAEVVVAAEPGIWLAYAVKTDDDDDLSELVAVHRTKVGELAALCARARHVGSAPIDGAHFAIFDEAIAQDDETMERMQRAIFDIVDGRCAAVALGGDGVAQVHAAFVGKRAICVRATL